MFQDIQAKQKLSRNILAKVNWRQASASFAGLSASQFILGKIGFPQFDWERANGCN